MFRNAWNKFVNALPKPKVKPTRTIGKDLKNRSKMAEKRFAREEDAKNLERLRKNIEKESKNSKKKNDS